MREFERGGEEFGRCGRAQRVDIAEWAVETNLVVAERGAGRG